MVDENGAAEALGLDLHKYHNRRITERIHVYGNNGAAGARFYAGCDRRLVNQLVATIRVSRVLDLGNAFTCPSPPRPPVASYLENARGLAG